MPKISVPVAFCSAGALAMISAGLLDYSGAHEHELAQIAMAPLLANTSVSGSVVTFNLSPTHLPETDRAMSESRDATPAKVLAII